MASTGIACHSFGAESACQLCGMIDMDAARTVVALGLPIPPDVDQGRESAFAEHLGRAIRGGWAPKVGTSAYRVAINAGLLRPVSSLPVEAPF
jgi:hypothetical protein